MHRTPSSLRGRQDTSNLVYLNRRPPLDDFSQHASMPHHFYQFQIHIILIPRHSVKSFRCQTKPLYSYSASHFFHRAHLMDQAHKPMTGRSFISRVPEVAAAERINLKK
jgi:hypothetical protein